MAQSIPLKVRETGSHQCRMIKVKVLFTLVKNEQTCGAVTPGSWFFDAYNENRG